MREVYSYNKKCLLRNNKPWFPVMGEMHYSRYKESLWEESLRKIKAGGVDIVASYVIWIHHEEEEGIMDFSGCRNLRKFVETCHRVGLKFFLRLGPWIHAEVRNGGFPDWLIKKPIEFRTNDEKYMAYVQLFWKAIFEQVKGYMHKDGGPIIGVQIENEYAHAGGGIGGIEGELHMKRLTSMAKDIGFEVPYYTATGWGGAVTGGLLPVMGGYCEAPWDQRTTEIEANDNYVFDTNRNDANIANDHHKSEELTFDPSQFPYLTAELGGGLQPTHHRRPVPRGKDIGAMSLVKMGSGVSLLGYYMYHGGSNPQGKLSTLQESKATGYLNDLPEINYDFRAPIRQYGQISDAYKEIKRLALFLKDFGEDMAGLDASIERIGINPEDINTLRLSWRHDEEHGYVFFNNYQRKRTMSEHKGVSLVGKAKRDIQFPPVDILSGEYGFFPYGMKLDSCLLYWATATPLCRLEGQGDPYYVFYGKDDAIFKWKDDKAAKILYLSREESLNAYKIKLDKDYLILSEDSVWEDDGKLKICGSLETQISCFPELQRLPEGFVKIGRQEEWTIYRRQIKARKSELAFHLNDCGESEDPREKNYRIQFVYGEGIFDCRIGLDYVGDGLEVYVNGEKVNDHFYTGEILELSMRYFDFPSEIDVRILPFEKDAPCYLEHRPKFEADYLAIIQNIFLDDVFI